MINLIVLGVVGLIAVAMIAMGASRDAFLGVILGLGGVGLMAWTYQYRNKPYTYTDDAGNVQTLGRAGLIVISAIGAALLAGGLFIGIHGLE
jgi:hypothetical protein